jgi:hypothetical protein
VQVCSLSLPLEGKKDFTTKSFSGSDAYFLEYDLSYQTNLWNMNYYKSYFCAKETQTSKFILHDFAYLSTMFIYCWYKYAVIKLVNN